MSEVESANTNNAVNEENSQVSTEFVMFSTISVRELWQCAHNIEVSLDCDLLRLAHALCTV